MLISTKKLSRHRLLGSAGFACGLAALLAIPAQGQSDEENDEVFTLSPFTISADSDQGYRATSTLAGTRIKTDLKDLGAAISVVTQEFMEDTGVTSLEDLFQYTTGTEIGGVDGNYSASDLAAGGGRVDQDESRREPQAGGRIRGLATPNYTRNYFSTSIPIDRYNTSSITISRGPNSLLFGLGSAGGVVDASLGLAGIGNNRSKVQIRIDGYGSERLEYDFNRTLIEGRLAVKVSGMYEDRSYRQEEASSLSKRFYGAFDAVLFKGGDGILGKTSMRGNVELGEQDLTPPDGMPPLLAWDSFFRAPLDLRPYSGIDYRQTYDVLATGFEKWGTLDTRRSIDPVSGDITPGYDELTTPLHSTSHIFSQLGLVYAGAPGEGPSAVDTAGSVGIQGWISGSGSLPFTNPFVNTRSYYETDGSAGFKNGSLTNADVFDFRNHLITGSLQEIRKTFDSQAISLEQILFDGRGGIELTAGREFYHLDRYQPFGGGGRDLPIYVDTTEYLSDTKPNPNVGKAFVIQQGDRVRWNTTQRENLRGTAFYDLDLADLSDGWARHLGRHVFTGLYQEEDRTNKNADYNKYWTGVGGTDFKTDVWNRPGNSNDTSFAGQFVQLIYLSDDLRGVEEHDVRLSPIDIVRPRDLDTFKMNYYDAQDEAYKTGNFQVREFPVGAGAGRTVVSSEALAWQSYLLNDNIVGLAGWRTDTIDTYGQQTWNPRFGNNSVDVEKATVVAANPNSIQEGKTFTWSVVAHLPQKYVDNIGFISSASAHFGSSENFQAIKQRRDIRNNPIDNPAGITDEYGFSLGFAENKWNLRLTRYETSQAFADLSNDPSFNAINEITRSLNSYKDAELSGVDFTATSAFQHGVASYDELYSRILGLVPAETQAIYQYAYDPVAEEFDNNDNIEGLSATTDVVAEGYEAELVGNPTNNWRIMLNVAKVQTIRDNTATETFAYAMNHLQALQSSGLADMNDTSGGIVTMLSRYRNQVVQPLISQRAKDGTVSQEQREWRVNLVNNYTFKEGRFKGFNVGGALRYQSSVATGYEVMLDDGVQLPNLSRPFEGSDEINGDLWLAYNKKLGNGVNWKVQLNVRNVIGDKDLIPVYTNPNGVDAVFRIPPDESWFLTNTFTF